MTPIRKGQSPVKIPFPIRTTDKTLAAWFNETRTAIQQLASRVPTAPVGRANTAGGSRPPFWTSISQVPDSDPATYQVTVTLGYLSYQSNTPAAQASDLGTTGWLVPKINGVSMESEDVEPLALPANESWVYLRVKTDVDGFPKEGEVTVEAFDEAQESIHHIRLSPESGEEEGDYFFLILKTIADDSTPPKPIAERRITGNREMPNQMIEILNLGEEEEEGRQEIYKGYDKALDKHDLRAVLQQQTPGVAIIEPLDEGADEVPPLVDGSGQVIRPGTPAVPPEEPGDYIRWRTIADRSSEGSGANTQIVVEEVESEEADADGRKRSFVKVRGNAKDINYRDPFGGGVDFIDGMATLIVDPDPANQGDSFNIELLNLQISEVAGEINVVNIGWGGTGIPRKWYVRNGLLFLNDDGANVDTYEVISRIEGESNPSTNQSGDGFTAAS